jgi:AraC-like DNA-binding protein
MRSLVQVATQVFETPCGSMTMSICRVPRLAGILDHLWHCDGVIVDRRERVLPNGTFELVLALGDRHRLVGEVGTSLLPAASWTGMRLRPLVLEHPHRCDTLGIILTPVGAYALLSRSLSELGPATIDACNLLQDTEELADRCAGTPVLAARFALVERWLTTRIARAKAPDAAVAWMAAQIERGGNELRVAALRKETGLSKARLVAAFGAQIGVRPKQYARLVRFRSVLDRLGRAGTRLSDVALDAGYYDQAHMNAEFRELAGISPTEFLAARFAEGSGNTAREPV